MIIKSYQAVRDKISLRLIERKKTMILFQNFGYFNNHLKQELGKVQVPETGTLRPQEATGKRKPIILKWNKFVWKKED